MYTRGMKDIEPIELTVLDATKPSANASSQVQRLTTKQKRFIKGIIDNPKASATEIASEVYNTKNRNVASAIASENLSKPMIASELAKHSKEIEQVITDKTYELVHSDKLEAQKEGLLNARWIHDKIHGKATQRTEVTTQGITINVDLSSSIE